MEQVANVEMATQLVAAIRRQRPAIGVATVRGDDTHGVAGHPHEASDLVGAPQRPDLEERVVVGDHPNRAAHVEGRRTLARHERQQLLLAAIRGIGRPLDRRWFVDTRWQVAEEAAGLVNRVLLGLREVVDRTIAAMNVPAAELFLRDIVTHGVAHDRRTGDEQLGNVTDHHREMPEHRLGRTNPHDAAQQHVDDGNRRKLVGVVAAAEMAGEEGAATAHHARPPRLDGPRTFLDRGIRSGVLLGHHGGDTAAARRSIEQADRGCSELDRQSVEVARLLTDRPVGMSAARGEVVCADDAWPAVDTSLPADMARRREFGDVARFVKGGETGQAADLAKAAAVEQRVDPFAAGEFVPIALADHAGLTGIRGQPLVGDRLERRNLVQHRRPALVHRSGVHGERRVRGRRLDDRKGLAGIHRITDSDRRQGFYCARTRRADGAFHLHGGYDEQYLARCHRIADAGLDVDDRARVRALDG